MLQDRQFDTNGQLFFPDSDNPANLNGPPGNPDKHPFWIPEFFGDVITVNGKTWPTLEVQPRRYRFRFVNGSNARFLHHAAVQPAGVDMHQNGAPGPAIWQIGSDGGFFNTPVKLDDPANGPNACAGAPDRQQQPTSRPAPSACSSRRPSAPTSSSTSGARRARRSR